MAVNLIYDMELEIKVSMVIILNSYLKMVVFVPISPWQAVLVRMTRGWWSMGSRHTLTSHKVPRWGRRGSPWGMVAPVRQGWGRGVWPIVVHHVRWVPNTVAPRPQGRIGPVVVTTVHLVEIITKWYRLVRSLSKLRLYNLFKSYQCMTRCISMMKVCRKDLALH